MTEPAELEEPGVADVPEPDQEPHAPHTADDEAEAEAEDEAAESTPEGELEAREPQARSAFDDPDRRKKVERSFDTYTAMVNKQYEEEALSLIRCPLCPDNFPGFVHPNDFGRYPEQVKATIMEVLGFAREQEYERDPELQVCPTCKGKGRTKRPSLVGGNSSRVCPSCGGEGDNIRSAQHPVAQTNGSQDAPAVLVTHDDFGRPDPDGWGQPRVLPNGVLNPNWGKTPDFWVPVEPWGDTRNLTSQDATA